MGDGGIWYNLLMMRVISTIITAIALASPACAEPRVIRTIPEARSLSHEDFVTPLNFELRGRLVYAANEHTAPSDRTVVMEQDGQRLILHTTKERPVEFHSQPGDTILLRGQTEFRSGIYDRFRIDHVETLEHGDPPPPEHATVGEILDGLHDLKIVTVRGEMSAVFKDEIDARWYYCILRDGERKLHLAVCDDRGDPAWTHDIVGAEVEATGLCNTFYGLRKFVRPGVRVSDPNAIRIVRPAPDPFDVPELEDKGRTLSIDDVMSLGRRRVNGRVLAAWGGNRVIVKSHDGRIMRVCLSVGTPLPKAGESVCVAGSVTTDFFRLNLDNAVVRPAPPDTPPVAPEPVVLEKQFSKDMGSPRNKVLYFGRTVRTRGKVGRILHADDSCFRIDLDTSGGQATAIADPRCVPLGEVAAGCTVEVTGVFATDGENWRPEAPLPRVGEWSIVLRTPDDIRILSRPPWWTARRLFAVIAVLAAALAGFAVWNRTLRLLANRRGRELYREQIARASAQLRVDERTRLAAELHDSLSQNLSGIACQINVAKLTAGDGETKDLLATAERMLQSSRTELTRCISDLRCDTLEEPDFSTAIRKNLSMLALPAKVQVRFNIPRARVSDSTAHAILCIVRELASNAVRHGKAQSVRVAGSLSDGCLSFSVKDDGCGFDVEKRRGTAEGHFGIEGIKDRVNRLDGKFEITSSPGKGTLARVTIPLPANAALASLPSSQT